jgi:hypothetical protein
MDCVFDALVTTAAADVAGHRFAYLIVVGFWILYQQRRSLHDLAGLAISALWDIQLTPGFLNGVIAGGMKAFDGCDLPADHVGNRGDAGANGLFVDNHGACAAQSLATAKFRARQSGFIPEKPEEWEIRVAVPIAFLAVDFHLDHDRSSLFISCRKLFDVSENIFPNRSTPISLGRPDAKPVSLRSYNLKSCALFGFKCGPSSCLSFYILFTGLLRGETGELDDVIRKRVRSNSQRVVFAFILAASRNWQM